MHPCQLDIAILRPTLLLTPQFVFPLTELVSASATGKFSIIPPPVSCLCAAFEAVIVDRKAVIDARSAAATAASGLLLIYFSPPSELHLSTSI